MAELASAGSRTIQLQELARAVENLEESPLYGYRKEKGYHAVFGEGNPNASIVFIGEAPGERESKTGRPFVGASGRFLDELLESIGLRREEVYITNVVKDRPPKNRDPKPDEIRLYAPFLKRQIEMIQPRVLATLGRFSMDFVLELFEMPERGQKISGLHGKPLKAAAPYGEVAVLPLFHPAVALYNQGQRETLLQDFQVLKALID
jgi:DNA polymerase